VREKKDAAPHHHMLLPQHLGATDHRPREGNDSPRGGFAILFFY